MSASLRSTLGLLTCAALLGLVGLWLAVDNPSVATTDGRYICLAPYDTVRNGADNSPGGEWSFDYDEVAADCRAAGRHRYAAAQASLAGSGVVGLGALGAGMWSLTGARRRRRPHGS